MSHQDYLSLATLQEDALTWHAPVPRSQPVAMPGLDHPTHLRLLHHGPPGIRCAPQTSASMLVVVVVVVVDERVDSRT